MAPFASIRSVSFLVLLVVLAVFPGAVAEIAEKKARLHAPGLDPQYEVPLRSFLESSDRVYGEFFSSLGLHRQRSRPLQMKVLPNRGDFKEYQKAHSSSQSDYAFYSLFDAEVVTYDFGDLQLLLSNVFHEATHHYVRDFISAEKIPRCLDEGLAEIFEMGKFDGKEVAPGPVNPTWVNLVREAHKKQTLKPLAYYLELTPKDFVQARGAEGSDLSIAQCWALCQFLVYADSGHWRPLLAHLMGGAAAPGGVEKDLQTALPQGSRRSDLEESWLRFLGQLR